MVALARAAETASDEPLIRDPFAEPLVSTPELAGVREQVAAWWAGGAGRRRRGRSPRTSQHMINYQAVRTHFFDAYFADAAQAAGIRQVVLVAAGLDSRAYRLDWPAGTIVYEIDLPKVLEYKTETLARHGAEPVADRRPVPVDLRHDWPQALRDAGFDASRPTAWLAEGLLPFLPASAQEALFASIDALSGSGSRVAVENFGVDPEKRREAEEKWPQLRAKREARGQDTSFNPFDLWFDDEGRPDCADWFAAHGWTTSTVSARDEGLRLGRAPQPERPAVREQFCDGHQTLSRSPGAAAGSLGQILSTALPTGWLGSRLSPMSARATSSGRLRDDRSRGRTTMTTESVAPKTSEPPTAPPTPQPANIPATVDRLRKTFATGRTRDIEWRKRQLLQLAKLMEENEAAIAAALAEDLDRNPFEAFIADVATTAGEAKYRGQAGAQVDAPQIPAARDAAQLPGRGWVEYEPYGTVLIIGAWNYPFYLTLGPAVGAIAAGNAVILKPSEIAAASAHLMAELVPDTSTTTRSPWSRATAAVSQELIAQGLDRVMFTGGTEIGRKVYEGAAPHLTPCTLELGGKSPVIVAADADVDVAAKRIAWIKLLNAGQTCVAPDYVLADAKIRDELVSKIGAAITKFTSDEPQRDADRQPAPVRPDQRLPLRVRDGKVIVGGECDPSTLRIQPTVVVDPDPDGPLMQNEIFGPILPVITVQSLDDAIRFVNSRPKPLSAYLFTKTRETRERVIKEVPAGGMLVNHLAFQVSTAKLPFGGVGASGMGAYHGKLRLRGVQPPQVGADQTDPARPVELHLPAVHRAGLQDGPPAVLTPLLQIACDRPYFSP